MLDKGGVNTLSAPLSVHAIGYQAEYRQSFGSPAEAVDGLWGYRNPVRSQRRCKRLGHLTGIAHRSTCHIANHQLDILLQEDLPA
jgi:hypothetical protein